jgi:universal stress protein E
MRTLQTILLATDFRSVSKDALDAVAQLALSFGSQVSVLHVMQDIPLATQESYQRRIEILLMQPVLQRLAEKHVTVSQSSIRSGPVVSTIVDTAQEWDVDLIVIGAGVREESRGFMIGPTAEALIAQAPQPVLAVRPGDPPLEFKKILCPVDQSNTSARGLRNAVRLAKVFGGEIIVLTVIPEVSWLTAAVETGEFVDAKAEHAAEWVQEFERFMADIDLSGVVSKREVRDGAPHERIVAAANEHRVDLIMMGATGRTGLVRALLGSTTRRLVRSLPCSLLTIKQESVLEDLFENDVRRIELLSAKAQDSFDGGAFRQAIAKYEQILSRDPFHLGAMEGLRSSHDQLGEKEEADGYRRRLARLQRGAESRADSKHASTNLNERSAGQS